MTQLPPNAPSVVAQRLRGTLAPTQAPQRRVPSTDFAAVLQAQTNAFDLQSSVGGVPGLQSRVPSQVIPALAKAAPVVAPFMGAVAGPLLARGAVRVSQSDTSEYATVAEAQRWGGSSCSAASLTAVLRASGRDAKVGDVVKVLEANKGITVAQGLVSRPALIATARSFGVNATDSAMSFDQLAANAKRGPVLVDITNGKFPEGHWVTITSADANGVSLVDSSGYKLTRMTRAEFTAAWSGRGITLGSTAATPQPTREVSASA